MGPGSLRVRLRVIVGAATALGIFSTFQACNYVSLFTEREPSFPDAAGAECHLLVRVGDAGVAALVQRRHIVVLGDGTRLTLSRGYRDRVQRQLSK